MLRIKTLNSYLFGEAEYFDVFKNWHRIKFCYRLLGGTAWIDDEGLGRASDIGIVRVFVPNRLEIVRKTLLYRLCRRNNCIDDQCGERHERPTSDHPNVSLVKEYPPIPNQNGNKLLTIRKR